MSQTTEQTDTPAATDDRMTRAHVTCPSCRAALPLRRPPRPGTLARCPRCRTAFAPDPPADSSASRLDSIQDALAEALDREPLTGGTSAQPPPGGPVTVATPGGPPPGARSGEFPFLAPPQAADEIGRLGPFRVLGVIGKGGMGVVFRAEDTGLRRHVAVKAMLPHIAADAGARARFLREARAQAKVEHDHVAPIHLVSEDGPVPFLAMPLLKGESLVGSLRTCPTVRVGEAVRIAREVAAGLAAAHATGLVHRDVTPGNVWLEGDGRRVKLLDFGLARAVADPGDQLTRVGGVVGTPAYMSPEQARGESIDHRSDLFSLGCVLYLLLAHRPAFSGGSMAAVLVAVATKTPRPPSAFNVLVSPGLDDLVMQLLAKSPGDRPATAAEVADRLAALEADPQAGGAVTGDWSNRSGVAPRPPAGGREVGSRVLPPVAAPVSVVLVKPSDAAEADAPPSWNHVTMWLMSTATTTSSAASAAASAAAAAAATAAAVVGLRVNPQSGLAMWLAGAGAAAAAVAAALVLVVVLHLFRPPHPPGDDTPPVEVAKNATQPPAKNPAPLPAPKVQKTPTPEPDRGAPLKAETPESPKKNPGTEPPKTAPPVAPPLTERPVPPRPVFGKATTAKTILVTRTSVLSPAWLRLDPATGGEVVPNQDIVCLPGYKADIQLSTGLSVGLWGNVPDLLPAEVLGARVRFHETGGRERQEKARPAGPPPAPPERAIDADFTLFAGRVYLVPTAGPLRVRMRAAGETYDLNLAAGSEVAVELTRTFDPGQPFDRTRAHPTRATLFVAVVRGSAGVAIPGTQHDNVPAPAVVAWNSKTPTQLAAPRGLEKSDTYFDRRAAAKFEQGASMQKALDAAADQLTDKYKAEFLMTQLATARPTARRSYHDVVGIYGLAALATTAKDLDTVVDALSDPTRKYTREAAAAALAVWLPGEGGNTADLGAILDVRLRPAGAGGEALRLLHEIVDPAAPNPADLDRRVNLLMHPSVAVRELALWNLITVYPAATREPGLIGDVGVTGQDHDRLVRTWQARVAEIKKQPVPKK